MYSARFDSAQAAYCKWFKASKPFAELIKLIEVSAVRLRSSATLILGRVKLIIQLQGPNLSNATSVYSTSVSTSLLCLCLHCRQVLCVKVCLSPATCSALSSVSLGTSYFWKVRAMGIYILCMYMIV